MPKSNGNRDASTSRFGANSEGYLRRNFVVEFVLSSLIHGAIIYQATRLSEP